MKNYFYKIYNTILASEIEYPQLLKTQEAAPEIWIKVIKEIDGDSEEDYANHVYTVSKSRIHFSNHKGSFIVTDGTTISIRPKKGIPMTDLTPFVFGYCIAMVFWQRGQLAIHCSAVKWKEKALIICGGSGSGKSTLTTKILEHGGKLMTDDVAVVDFAKDGKALVLPAFPQQKLCRDAVARNEFNTEELLYIDEDKDKFAISRVGEFCDEPTELGGIVALNRYSGNAVVAEQLQGHATLQAILDNLFMKPVFEASLAFPPEDMMKCIKIAQTVPVYKLLRPMTGDTTEDQIQSIKKLMKL
ncbi:MAG: hypothetical protein J6C07_08165 [Lachnospiraceae bacterium]|nr:hypothetical protein [Lachnospiraceae bacterium]